jgi:hypothetical protein
MTFSEIDWNDQRMIVLSCGHVCTMETMDNLMEMRKYYEGSTDEGWTSIRALPTSPINIIKCPMCRTPVKNIRRYGRIINKYTLDVQNKKFLIKYNRKLNKITEQVIILEKETINSRDQLMIDLYGTIEKRININTKSSEVVPYDEIFEATPYKYFKNIEEYHGFDKASRIAWANHVNKLLGCYYELTLIIRDAKTPPHKVIEAAVSSL